MKQNFIFLLILFFSITVCKAQIMGTGYATGATDINIPMLSGGYEIENFSISGYPDNDPHTWKHLLVLRHGNANNNHQFQITTSFAENDRLFFRKIAKYTLEPFDVPWHEVATRGSNTFNGNQVFYGNIGIGTLPQSSVLSIRNSSLADNAPVGSVDIFFATTHAQGIGNKISAYKESFNTAGIAFFTQHGYAEPCERMRIASNGNVGIGTTNPTSKLTVAGDIRAREVKVEANAGADFVFSEDYRLRPLGDVESFIKENKHLPDIAPADSMVRNGVNMGEMQIQLLQKIEELTLYMIELEKRSELQQKLIEAQAEQIGNLTENQKKMSQRENQSVSE